MGRFQPKYSLIFSLALALAAISMALFVPPATLAQAPTATPTFNEHWFTPTPTPTFTPMPAPTSTYGPGTPTNTPTMTPGPGTPTVTATPVAMPQVTPFPYPHYPVPTSIPIVTFPTVSPDGYTPPTLTIPEAITESNIITPTDLLTVSTSITLSYSSPLTPTYTGGITGTGQYTSSGILGTMGGWISNTISYTNWLSGQAASIQYSGTFTIYAAPAWYAPSLPRPMANIGWTFEQLQYGIDLGHRYSMNQWAWFVGYISSMPIQFIKILLQLAEFLGPLGLFVYWLLIMLPVVLVFKIWAFIKGLFINLANFLISFVGLIIDLVKLLL